MSVVEKHVFCTSSQPEKHKVVYSCWGTHNNDPHPIICIHGLTGNGFDFDFLARDLVKRGRRLICIDLPGRGRSDFLSNPEDYSYAQYIQDIHAVLTQEDLTEPHSVDWIGISLGGLLGICMAGVKDSPIRRMVIDDVGPVVPKAALKFIHQVISVPYYFVSVEELEIRMRATRGLTWGPVTEEQWHHMAQHNHRVLEDGRITYAYDPNIAVVFEKEPVGNVDLWERWDAITCPVFVIRGKQSTLLTNKIVKMMRKRIPNGGPEFDLAVLPGCGHAPSLMAPEQIDLIHQWLEDNPV